MANDPRRSRGSGYTAYPWLAIGSLVVTVAIVAWLAGNRDRSATASPDAGSRQPSPTLSDVGSSTPGDRPTIDTALVDPCPVGELAMAAGGWSGATGSIGGGATLINMSPITCSVSGTPELQLVAGGGAVIAAGPPATTGPSVTLAEGATANLIAVWSNWCGDPPLLPLTLRLSLADVDGALSAVVRDWEKGGNSLPRCDAAGSPSTIGAPQPFVGADPSSGGSGAAPCIAADLQGFLGGWGAAASSDYANIAVLNRSGEDCSLATSPPLELRDADGTLLATGEPWTEGAGMFDLPAGAAALTTIGFGNWCIAAPKLPFQFELDIGGGPLLLAPTSERSEIGAPYCNSAPETPPPSLGYTGPFHLPES